MNRLGDLRLGSFFIAHPVEMQEERRVPHNVLNPPPMIAIRSAFFAGFLFVLILYLLSRCMQPEGLW